MAKPALDTDMEIGRRIKVQRLARGMSQTDLGQACGITFQQIQKYEKGANRVGGGRLQQIADALGVKPAVFFDAGGAEEDHMLRSEIAELLVNPGAIALLRYYAKLPPSQRKAIVPLMAVLAGNADADELDGPSMRKLKASDATEQAPSVVTTPTEGKAPRGAKK